MGERGPRRHRRTGGVGEFGQGYNDCRRAPVAADWQRPGEALAIMHPDTYRRMKSRGFPMVVLHDEQGNVAEGDLVDVIVFEGLV